ncbi:hypothetical protein Q5530_07980 [Saccharothrix sp. BKS2]|uniref:hypothetical protein n=1 Tax=Saccharothrix sp. BKS2 TaxID=3064400 RepID=UPI0039E7875B
MTTAIRLSAGPARLLPPVLPALLLLLAVVLAPVAPAKASNGLYRVDTPEFSVVEGFECAPSGHSCSVVVAGRVLTVRAELLSPCSAEYDGRSVSCRPVSQYGPAEPWVEVGSLGVSPDQAPRTPLWRDAIDRWWTIWWLGGALGLGLLMALATAVLYRGPRLPDEHQSVRTLVTGVVCWLVPAAATLIVEPAGRESMVGVVLVAPHFVLLPAALMAVWQHLAGGPQSGRLRGRLGQAAMAAVATTLYFGGGVIGFAMAAGLPD